MEITHSLPLSLLSRRFDLHVVGLFYFLFLFPVNFSFEAFSEKFSEKQQQMDIKRNWCLSAGQKGSPSLCVHMCENPLEISQRKRFTSINRRETFI